MTTPLDEMNSTRLDCTVMSTSDILLLVVGLCVRLLLLRQSSYEWLGQRIEISTPVNQWMRGRPRLGDHKLFSSCQLFSIFFFFANYQISLNL